MGTSGDPWAPLGAYGALWGPMGTYWHLWGPMGTFGGPWGPMGAYGHLFVCHFPCSHIFPIFPFWCSKSFLLLYCHVSDCPRWFPNDFSIVSSLFVFFIWGGGVDLDLGIVSPNFLWALDP